MHTNTVWLKFGSLSPAVTLKIRSRSPNPKQLFIMSQCYIHANLVKIHLPVHEISCKQESVTLTPTPTPTLTLTPKPTGSAPKTICASPLVGDIILLKPALLGIEVLRCTFQYLMNRLDKTEYGIFAPCTIFLLLKDLLFQNLFIRSQCSMIIMDYTSRNPMFVSIAAGTKIPSSYGKGNVSGWCTTSLIP